MGQILSISDIKKLFPDEWVLVGNPVMDDAHLNVLSGIPIIHSKDKKEVYYLGRSHTPAYDTITIIYTGTFKPMRKITGIFNSVKKRYTTLKACLRKV